MTHNNMTQREIWRSDTYRLLAACFYEPDRDLFVEENLISSLAKALRESGAPDEESCQIMAKDLQNLSQEELLVEYSALFLGPFKVAAPPYGSVYLEQSRQLMGDSTMLVRKMYHGAGIDQNVEGPPDHISLELEFMSYLASRLAHAMANGDETGIENFSVQQHEFYNKCLARWITPFNNAIHENAKLAFYPALSHCLVTFITREVDVMHQMAATQAVVS